MWLSLFLAFLFLSLGNPESEQAAIAKISKEPDGNILLNIFELLDIIPIMFAATYANLMLTRVFLWVSNQST